MTTTFLGGAFHLTDEGAVAESSTCIRCGKLIVHKSGRPAFGCVCPDCCGCRKVSGGLDKDGFCKGCRLGSAER